MLYYVPLESLKERYSMQWSAPKTGWLERRWIEAGIDYTRIDGLESPDTKPGAIKTGSVVDAVGRSLHCFKQMEQLLHLAEAGKITDDDVVYFDDFWTPGIEALPYAFHLLGIKPKMYAFLHAQSVDEFDFTHPMRGWMRHYERGQAAYLDGIFVCGHTLKDLVVHGGICDASKVHVTGHPLASDEVKERMPEDCDYEKFKNLRKNNVVYASRWDDEKNPLFFLKVVAAVVADRPDITFTICTGSTKIKSNNQKNIDALLAMRHRWPNNLYLRENLTKEEYYEELFLSKAQMNTANQDFVAITLLEASVAGCWPIYPYFRSFPETLNYKPQYMYQHLDLEDAVRAVIDAIDQPNETWSDQQIKRRQWIHTRFDTSWYRQAIIMGLIDVENRPLQKDVVPEQEYLCPYHFSPHHNAATCLKG